MSLHCLKFDYGLRFKSISRHMPFTLIHCPLCHGVEFTSLEGAEVWCDRCNAAFTVDYTSGDPGFTVECTWQFYSPSETRYILPRWSGAALTLTLKDSDDLLDLRHTCACAEGCRPGHLALTAGADGLRPGLHRCAIGTLYEWRLSGATPMRSDVTDTNRRVGPDRWPEIALLRASGLEADEQALLRLAAASLQSRDADAAEQVRGLASLRRTPAWLFSAPLPPFAALADGQFYLLHHWVTYAPPDRPGDELALSVWYVVTESTAPGGDVLQPNLKILRQDLCPACGLTVTPEQSAHPAEAGAHAGCARLWRNFGWSPAWEEAKPSIASPAIETAGARP